MRIKETPVYERPYEKVILFGEKSLTNSELLSIIIKTGTKKKSALQIAEEIIDKALVQTNNLRFLQEVSIDELTKIDGIGQVKAIQLKAVGEIAKRIAMPINIKKKQIKSKKDVADIFMEELRYEKSEKLILILLNNKNIVQKILNVSSGNDYKAIFDIKQILSEPIKLQIPKIILVHNHPSGDPMPSNEDIDVTKKVFECSRLMGIQLLDHIIIGDGIYESALILD